MRLDEDDYDAVDQLAYAVFEVIFGAGVVVLLVEVCFRVIGL